MFVSYYIDTVLGQSEAPIYRMSDNVVYGLHSGGGLRQIALEE